MWLKGLGLWSTVLRAAALVALLSLAGCGGGCSYILRPAPIEDPVDTGAVVGTWAYHTLRGEEVRIRFNADGTFEQTLLLEPGALSKTGNWRLRGSSLELDGFYDSTWPERSSPVRFYMTDWYTSAPAPFGGEADQDHWTIWRRVEESTSPVAAPDTTLRAASMISRNVRPHCARIG